MNLTGKQSTSLLEIKKLQWARERAEEMRHYGGIWGNLSDASEPRYRPCIKGTHRSTTDLKNVFEKTPPIARRRTPSLPPIPNQYEPLSPSGDDSGGGDTSGYASDSADFVMSEPPWKPNWQQPGFGPRRTPESFSSGSGGREERAKWGERGVGVGHLWSPSVHLPGTLLPQIEPTTPSWIQRSLQEPAQVLVISHDESLPASLANSHDMSRSTETLTSTEEFQRSYIRGQNAPIDPHVAAEKERRRQKAIEHQNAIKEQLEEKERKKREEQERLEREEMMEEERLRRHHELEVQRLEEEKRRLKEKEEKDERVAKALREAIEIAEKRAKEEKSKARRKHLVSDCRSPQPQPQFNPQTDTTSRFGQMESGCRTTTLRFEREKSNIEVIERRASPCSAKNELLVYHTEVVVKSPPPLRTPEKNPRLQSPAFVPSRSGSGHSRDKSPRNSARKSPRTRRNQDRQSPHHKDQQDKSELDLVPERDIGTSRVQQSTPTNTEEHKDNANELPERFLQVVPITANTGAKEAKEPDKEESKMASSIEQTEDTKKSVEHVDRGVSPLNISSSQSTSPSQDPPPPPKGSTYEKNLPSDAAEALDYEEQNQRNAEEYVQYQRAPGSPDLDDILTVAVREFSIDDDDEVEVSRLRLVPSPTLARLLTPSIHRGGPHRSEVATQTETRSSRPTRRNLRLEDRPKWGVNRPSTRYIKASDRYPFSRLRNNDTDDSRSPSPLNNRKSINYTNFLPMTRLRNSSVESSSKPRKESKAINTPRLIQILPKPGLVRKNSAGRRYLSFKGSSRLLQRPQGPASVLPKKLDLTELLTVKDVLSQLTSLKCGLRMKQREWDLSRSQTPFSEVSSIG